MHIALCCIHTKIYCLDVAVFWGGGGGGGGEGYYYIPFSYLKKVPVWGGRGGGVRNVFRRRFSSTITTPHTYTTYQVLMNHMISFIMEPLGR